MKIGADVRGATGLTKHFMLSDAGLRVPLPVAVRVEIESENSGFLMIRYDAKNEFCGDTWHSSLDESKGQATAEYGISVEDWRDASA